MNPNLTLRGEGTWSYDFVENVDLNSATELDRIIVSKLAWKLGVGELQLAFSMRMGHGGKHNILHLLRLGRGAWFSGGEFHRDTLMANTQGNPLLWPHLVYFLTEEVGELEAIAGPLLTGDEEEFGIAEARMEPFLVRAKNLKNALAAFREDLQDEADRLAR